MDTKALRQKILDLAVRGKLVPQAPDDEPASMLLERIRAEKQQMVKEGKLKAKDIKKDTIIFRGDDNLHYEKFADGSVKCIEDEIPFEVPEGWVWCRIATVCSILTDGTHKTPTYSDKGYIFLSSKNVTRGVIDWDNIMHIPESLHNELYVRLAPHLNDILLAKNGTTGVAALVDRECVFDIYVSLALMRIVKEIILPQYVLNVIESSYVQDYFNNSLKGIGVPNLHLEHIRNTLIPVSPYQEQLRIVEKLNKIIPLLHQIQHDKYIIIQLSTKVKSKLLDLAIRGKLVPQDPDDEPASVLLERIRSEKDGLIELGKIKRDKKESIIFRGDDSSYYEKIDNHVYKIDNECQPALPNGWEYARLKSICTKIVDGSHNPPKGQNHKTEYLMMSSRNINDNTFIDLDNVRYLSKTEFEKENERTLIAFNDILLTTVGSLGRSCIYQKNPLNLCFQRSVTVISTLILPQYLKLYFDSPCFQRFMNDNANGTAQKGFYLNQLENVIIPVPPISEQHTLVSCVEELMRRLNQIYLEVRS